MFISLSGEWTSPVYKYVDPMAKADYSDSVDKLMKTPQPPAQLPDRPLLRPPPQRPMSADAKEAARKEFKYEIAFMTPQKMWF